MKEKYLPALLRLYSLLGAGVVKECNRQRGAVLSCDDINVCRYQHLLLHKLFVFRQDGLLPNWKVGHSLKFVGGRS